MSKKNMNDKTQYSDEHLNAFIDDQLDKAEKAEILDAVRHDAELSQRICKLQKLHNLVQLSYQSIEVPERHKTSGDLTSATKFKWFIAASVFLAVGTIAGWISHQTIHPSNLSEFAQVSNNFGAENNPKHWKLMLHVSTAKPHRLNIVLDEAEALLEEYADSSNQLELEILANSDGLALVTNSGKDYNKRLQKLQQKYANLAVMVCGQTIKRIQRTQGKKPKLLPNTNVVSSAINQVVKRQQGGWSYIRI
jgi:intracellular sulfur oxidation DsrE/DsrF family protein